MADPSGSLACDWWLGVRKNEADAQAARRCSNAEGSAGCWLACFIEVLLK